MNVNNQDVNSIKMQIQIAREWALEHFNAENAENERLVSYFNFVKPSFFVEFHTPDTMIIWPSIMGRKGFPSIHYRLAFNPLEWHGTHPFYNTPYPPLVVDKLFIKLREGELSNYGEDTLDEILEEY